MEKKRMNDKGFSLVELIIVIAIMAILIGVLAPQYLKFVERSRKSTDKQNVDAIIDAVQIDAADPETNYNCEGTITITTTSTAVSATNATADLHTILENAGIKKLQLKSSKWTFTSGTDLTLTFTVDANGNVSVTTNCAAILE